MKFTITLSAIVLAGLLAGCANVYQPVNQPISTVDESQGYRRVSKDRSEEIGDTMVLLAFSGGGTRAAALSYGVMQELRDTYVQSDGVEVRLLDEIDTISSVSGGSFTAAYYGLFRDKLFEDYESAFLRQNVQSTLICKLLSPGYWISSAFSGFDRTEMAIDFYDRTIFKGATFADMEAKGPPYIDINATDLTTGMRFTFSQDLFDMICSDLGEVKIARAVTASSAVPVAFPTIVLENHADKCDISNTQEYALLTEDRPRTESQKQLVENLLSYRDAETRKFIHLVDGGISDNLGLRAMIDRLEGMGERQFERLGEAGVKNILVILVNAAVTRESFIQQTSAKPSPATTMSAFIDSQMNLFTNETMDRARSNIARFQQLADERNLPVKLYFSEVAFDHIQVEEASKLFNRMPTSLELDDDEVDQLIAAGRILLRHEPHFQTFKQRNKGRLAEDAMPAQEICRYIEHPNCSAIME